MVGSRGALRARRRHGGLRRDVFVAELAALLAPSGIGTGAFGACALQPAKRPLSVDTVADPIGGVKTGWSPSGSRTSRRKRIKSRRLFAVPYLFIPTIRIARHHASAAYSGQMPGIFPARDGSRLGLLVSMSTDSQAPAACALRNKRMNSHFSERWAPQLLSICIVAALISLNMEPRNILGFPAEPANGYPAFLSWSGGRPLSRLPEEFCSCSGCLRALRLSFYGHGGRIGWHTRRGMGGPGCSDRFPASISGTSAGVRPPSGLAASSVLHSRLDRASCRQAGKRAAASRDRDNAIDARASGTLP